MASIYDSTDGTEIASGMTDEQALERARELAADHGEAIHLSDSEGEYLVHPDGRCEPIQ